MPTLGVAASLEANVVSVVNSAADINIRLTGLAIFNILIVFYLMIVKNYRL